MSRKIFVISCLAVTIIFFKQSLCFAASAPASVKEGNSFYRQGKFDEALKYYNEAKVDMPDSDVVNFNMGAALYQKGDYEKAIKAFNKALLSDNPKIEEKAAYNIGNSKYRLGTLKKNTDLSSAVGLYREALDYYKRAIELNEKDINAKYNHEFVERELKILLDKLKRQSSSAKGSEDKEKQVEGRGQKAEGEEKKDEHKQREAARKDEEKEDKQKEQDIEQAKGYEAEQEAEGEMSEEEARMLLERYDQQDQSVGNMQRKARGRYYPPVLKDW
ncbi:MAG: hypothetical protein B5M48_03160 [Candidatus Omnitrophica bacterium 4484_213]|nr:MAG: hypothetical protein B5M48_03160 [Candidatus Omnitrophica bacterium 4484_213]